MDPALTKRFCECDSWLVHTTDFKNGSGPCLHGTHNEIGTTKHNWSAQCQYNVTGWVSIPRGGAPTPSLGIDCETDPESGSSD